jgi:hypothetical protein
VCEADAGTEIRNCITTTQIPRPSNRFIGEEFSQGIHDHLLVPQHRLQHLFLFVRHICPQVSVTSQRRSSPKLHQASYTADPRRFAFRIAIRLNHPWQRAINPKISSEGVMGEPIKDTSIKMNNC